MAEIFVIKKAIITEKATDLQKYGKYAFMVQPAATKNEIKKAVKDIYHVDVVTVNIINRPPKTKRFRNIVTKKGAYKKAIVTLKEGQKIEVI